jgi:hypothetical protein
LVIRNPSNFCLVSCWMKTFHGNLMWIQIFLSLE